MAAAAADSGAHYLEFVVDVSPEQSLHRYAQRALSGHDAVRSAADAPDFDDVEHTYDRLVAFTATRPGATSIPADTLPHMYRTLLDALQKSA